MNSWRINPYHFFGFIGLALYAAWIFLSYFNPQTLNLSEWLETVTANQIAAWSPMVIVTIIALGIAWKFSDFLSTNSGKKLLLVLAICTGPLASLSPLISSLLFEQSTTFEQNTTALTLTLWSLSGLAYAALLLLYSTLLITFEDRRITIFIASALIVGAAVYIFVVSTIPQASMFFSGACPTLSAICFILSINSRKEVIGRQQALIVVSAAESDEKDPINWRLIADTLTYTPCLGIGIYCVLHDISFPLNIICVGLAPIVSCLILVADTHWLHWLTSKMQLKLFLPLTALTVFPLAFTSGIAKTIIVFLLFVTFILSLITNYSAISLCVRVFELSPIRVFAYGRIFNLLGVVFGYAFAIVAFSAPLAANSGVGTILAFCALMLVFIIVATFILEDRYPISSDVDDNVIETNPSIPKRDLWDERCAEIAKKFCLSPRQSEVLNLLSKGRNTVYIQDKLVISHYTAKAHIYNIYQKIGIHSRQELLDLIEQIEM